MRRARSGVSGVRTEASRPLERRGGSAVRRSRGGRRVGREWPWGPGAPSASRAALTRCVASGAPPAPRSRDGVHGGQHHNETLGSAASGALLQGREKLPVKMRGLCAFLTFLTPFRPAELLESLFPSLEKSGLIPPPRLLFTYSFSPLPLCPQVYKFKNSVTYVSSSYLKDSLEEIE